MLFDTNLFRFYLNLELNRFEQYINLLFFSKVKHHLWCTIVCQCDNVISKVNLKIQSDPPVC